MQHSLDGVFAVPPLARSNNGARSIDFDQNQRIVQHITAGGITRLIYGGNAFFYHVTLAEFEQVLEWFGDYSKQDTWLIPSAGPSYGRLMDQAAILRRLPVFCVMTLPCGDPRDAAGIERGLREFAEAADVRLMLYLKEEHSMGADRLAGLDAVARLVDAGVCIAIKYAVVRQHAEEDAYLDELLRRVDRNKVISGIGERPAIPHLSKWHLQGFTTGSGCLAPALSASLHAACRDQRYDEAAEIRSHFLPLEDLRDAWGPARVLHHAVELSQVALTGPIPPFVSALSREQQTQLEPVAAALLSRDRQQETFHSVG
jgi:dihydrodipicolinate synthase/N-acetylneuraminate lyase